MQNRFLVDDLDLFKFWIMVLITPCLHDVIFRNINRNQIAVSVQSWKKWILRQVWVSIMLVFFVFHFGSIDFIYTDVAALGGDEIGIGVNLAPFVDFIHFWIQLSVGCPCLHWRLGKVIREIIHLNSFEILTFQHSNIIWRSSKLRTWLKFAFLRSHELWI